MPYYDANRRSHRYELNLIYKIPSDGKYSSTSGKGLISATTTTDESSVSSDYPAASPRYHPYTFYRDRPKSSDRIYHSHERRNRRDVRSGRDSRRDKKLATVFEDHRGWIHNVRKRLNASRAYRYRHKQRDSGGFSVKICVALSLYVVILMAAAGLGVNIGLAYVGDVGKPLTLFFNVMYVEFYGQLWHFSSLP